ncbi:MAG: hypothetical protein AB1489_37920 [Acidobacteriota bacterium]
MTGTSREIAGKIQLSGQSNQFNFSPPLQTHADPYFIRLYINDMEDGKATDYYERCVKPRDTICLKNGQVITFKGELVIQDNRTIELIPNGAGYGVADLQLPNQPSDYANISFAALRLQVSQPLNIEHIVWHRYESK